MKTCLVPACPGYDYEGRIGFHMESAAKPNPLRIQFRIEEHKNLCARELDKLGISVHFLGHFAARRAPVGKEIYNHKLAFTLRLFDPVIEFPNPRDLGKSGLQ
jgi:hypothetical protein